MSEKHISLELVKCELCSLEIKKKYITNPKTSETRVERTSFKSKTLFHFLLVATVRRAFLIK